MTTAIRAEGLGKRYRIGARSSYRDDYRTIRESLVGAVVGPLRRLGRGPAPPRDEEFWALRGVNFDVQAGEVVGIVGRNGAGKSTLLKVLSRITRPTTGRVELRGRVASLLEVGTGFHPELTGRENIYLNGSILGMRRSEIARKFDEIVAFAGMEKFLDTPVKRYSSGMYVRLAFAVAAHLEPEILIVDEVLAVGDAEFQRRCLGKMGEVARDGRTVLFVSHNMGAVQALCRAAILMDRGEVVRRGPTGDVLAAYHEQGDRLVVMPLAERTDRRGRGTYRFHEAETFDAGGRRRETLATGEDLVLRLTICGRPDADDRRSPVDISVLIRDGHGHLVTTLSTSFTGSSPVLAEGRSEVSCLVPRLPLLEGRYRVDLAAATSAEDQDIIGDALTLNVGRGDYFDGAGDARLPSSAHHGVIVIPQTWRSSARPAAGPDPGGRGAPRPRPPVGPGGAG